jgi:hypothetical protein
MELNSSSWKPVVYSEVRYDDEDKVNKRESRIKAVVSIQLLGTTTPVQR